MDKISKNKNFLFIVKLCLLLFLTDMLEKCKKSNIFITDLFFRGFNYRKELALTVRRKSMLIKFEVIGRHRTTTNHM